MEGFYKNDEGQLLYAPNFVNAPTYVLIKEEKDNYVYPIEGWYWFSDREEAVSALGIIETTTTTTEIDRMNYHIRQR
jgi:hypothetical protein